MIHRKSRIRTRRSPRTLDSSIRRLTDIRSGMDLRRMPGRTARRRFDTTTHIHPGTTTGRVLGMLPRKVPGMLIRRKVRGRRNKLATRATEIWQRLLSPASRACSPLFCYPQLGRRGDWATKLSPASRAQAQTISLISSHLRRAPAAGCRGHWNSAFWAGGRSPAAIAFSRSRSPAGSGESKNNTCMSFG